LTQQGNVKIGLGQHAMQDSMAQCQQTNIERGTKHKPHAL
jgi:hypothetical protein